MNTEELAAYVRSNCVDRLVEGYAERFSNASLQQFTDADMRDLATAWKAASPEDRRIMKAFMRLASQNTAATILSLVDEDSGAAKLQLTLSATTPDGRQYNLGRDLLSTFWEQEEAADRVNRRGL